MKKFAAAVAVVVVAAFAAPAFAAMNPFMDVPASHWAYDAVAQLAARGVISGYPDGTYKGAQPTTRYEMASALARALAQVDMEKASKQDVEMLKRLIVEFKDELDALGVKVDKLDERVKVIETDIGGWSISGQFRFDAKFSNYDGTNGETASYFSRNNGTIRGRNEFDLNRYRIYLRKRINETTSFTARLGADTRKGNGRAGVMWEQYYVDTKLGYDINMRVGVFPIDWEDQYGLYADDDAWYDDWHQAGFLFTKDWGKGHVELAIRRLDDDNKLGAAKSSTSNEEWNMAVTALQERFLISALAHYDFSEQFDAGIFAHFAFNSGDEKNVVPDASYANGERELDQKSTILGAFLRFRFTPGVEFKGVYYHQKQGEDLRFANGTETILEDTAKAWKIILDVNQDVLKFTSLWIEYGQMDNNFLNINNTAYGLFGSEILAWRGNYALKADNTRDHWYPLNSNTSKILHLRADQKWNDRWRTFLRYIQVDYDTQDWDTAKEWGLGVGYRLNPAVEFELSYNKIDYGWRGSRQNADNDWSDENLIRFRTFVSF